METSFQKKAMRLAVLGVGIMFIANFSAPRHPGCDEMSVMKFRNIC